MGRLVGLGEPPPPLPDRRAAGRAAPPPGVDAACESRLGRADAAHPDLAGLYNELAIALKGGPYREASLLLLAQKVVGFVVAGMEEERADGARAEL